MNNIIRIIRNVLIVIGVIVILFVTIWGPERLANYRDRYTLNQIVTQPAQEATEGYRYALSINEKLYILSECLSNQVLSETELSEKTQVKKDMDYAELNGTYALVTNYQKPTEKEIQATEVYEVFNKQLKVLKDLGVIPQEVKEIAEDSYRADLYSAIDVLEPGNSVSVWKVSLSTSQQNADKSNKVLDAYIDAQNGKVYEFYVRIEKDWSQLEPEEIVKKWSEYLGLTGMEVYETDNPLLETTPYFLKYRFPGSGTNSTIVTVGFYEGINELFLKITR